MTTTRTFSPADIPQKSDDYHGSCRYVRTSPDVASDGIKSFNIELTFDQAMRLSVALQSVVLGLNRHNRNSKIGREMGLCLSIKTDSTAISVIEQRVKPAVPKVLT
jgi:hypothetical protein